MAEVLRRCESQPKADIVQSLREARDQFEAEFIRTTLRSHDWNIQTTAEVLGIDRTHLWKKMRRFWIER
ncbi:hypothetical protein JXA02_06825 [candidate division KSB1 bacterium]|nr:hypothetical protein [candidate division KSB1 bacterium]RQW06814.1 MAG: hypothetical protein EH222_07975 [candidate division KSB1 bacterium]